jgi:hypothetical protein
VLSVGVRLGLIESGCQVRGPTEGLWIRTELAAMVGVLADQRC